MFSSKGYDARDRTLWSMFFLPEKKTIGRRRQVYFMERAKAAGVKEQKEEEEELPPVGSRLSREGVSLVWFKPWGFSLSRIPRMGI